MEKSISRTRAYSRVLAKNCRRASYLTAALCIGSVVFVGIHMILGGDISQGFMNMNMIYRLGTILGTAAVLSGILLIPPVFKELVNRQFADVEFSLPLSSSERYRAKLMMLVKRHILPFAAAQAAILIMAFIMLGGESLKSVIIDVIHSFANLLFTDSAAVLCVCCCGRLAESIYTPLVFGASVSALPALIMYKYMFVMSGRVTDTFDIVNLPFGYPELGPLLIDGHVYYELTPHFVLMNVINMLVSAALFLISFRLYKKRDGLTVGRPFAFKGFYYVFLCTLAAAVLLYFYMNGLYYGIIIGLAAFLAVSVTSQTGSFDARALKNSLGSFAVCTAAVLIIGFGAYVTAGFGYLSMSPASFFDSSDTEFYISCYAPGKNYYSQMENSVPKELIDESFEKAASIRKKPYDSFSEALFKYWDLVTYEFGAGTPDFGDGDYSMNVTRVRYSGFSDTRGDNMSIFTDENGFNEMLEWISSKGIKLKGHRYESDE